MDARIEWTVGFIGLLCMFGGFTIAYLTLNRTKKKEDKDEGTMTGQITSDMGYIKMGIDGINVKLEKQDERHIAIVERLCKTETSIASAHKRIDYLEGEK